MSSQTLSEPLSVRWRRTVGLLPATSRVPGDELLACAETRRSYAQLRDDLLSDPREAEGDLAHNNPLCASPNSGWARFFKNQARVSPPATQGGAAQREGVPNTSRVS